jgi:hypothetical protein
MVAVPADTPKTVPDATVATPVVLLLHTPPVEVSVKVVEVPVHTEVEEGDMAAAPATIFTTLLVLQVPTV